MTTITVAAAEADVRRCHAVMCELRSHLTLEQFTAQVERQRRTQGYALAMLSAEDAVRSVAGYRFVETLAWGRILYVDDLVTRAVDQGRRYGSKLIDWLIQQASEADCAQFHLDSGVQRFDAHRFYLHKGLDITSHHFALKLP